MLRLAVKIFAILIIVSGLVLLYVDHEESWIRVFISWLVFGLHVGPMWRVANGGAAYFPIYSVTVRAGGPLGGGLLPSAGVLLVCSVALSTAAISIWN